MNFSTAKLTDIARWNGHETDFANLQRMGVITKDAAGQWQEVGRPVAATFQGPVAPQAPQEQQQQQQGQQDNKAPGDDAGDQVELLDPATEQIASEFMSKATGINPEVVADRTMLEGKMPDDMAAVMASRLGITPGQVHEKVATLTKAFEQQGINAMGHNVVADWAQTHAREALTAAAREQVAKGTTGGYKAIARSYMERSCHPLTPPPGREARPEDWQGDHRDPRKQREECHFSRQRRVGSARGLEEQVSLHGCRHP